MRTRQPTTTLEDQRIPVRVKLAAAWTSFMFLYVYVDYFALYKPGGIGDILDGVVYEFQISQTLLTVFLASIAVPTLMILLSTTLPARANRATNLVVASLYIPYSAFNAVGESWTYFYGLGVALEVIVLALILRYAWTWPRTAPSATMATSPDREAVRAQQQNSDAVAHYLAADASPGAELVAAALAWRAVPPENDEAVLSLLEAGMVPLYLHYIDDQRARLAALGRHDLSEAFVQWRRRLLQ